MTVRPVSEPATAALRSVPVPDQPGAVVSVCCGVPGQRPAFARGADAEHYGASTIKIVIMAALYAAAERGELELDEQVVITDRFPSLAGAQFRADPDDDNDEQPWQRLGNAASLRWLCERMIVSSSNLASNLLLQRLGFDAVNRECPPGMSVGRQIGDLDARAAGLTNITTAAAAVALLGRIVDAYRTGTDSGRQMMRTLGHVVHRDGIPAALPHDVWVGNKPGWIAGTRHDCAVVAGPDTAPYVLAVCTTGLPDATALALIRRFAAASWQDREVFAEGRALVVPDRVS